MGLVFKGTKAIPDSGWKVVDLKVLKPGDTIFYLKGSPAVFKFLPESTILGIVEGWIKWKSEGEFVITGVNVNVDNGDIYIRGFIRPPEYLEAGINPYVITAIIAGLFAAAFLIGFVFVYAYQPAPGTLGDSLIKQTEKGTGPLDKLKDTATKLSWLTIGILVGIGVLTILMLRRAGGSLGASA